MSTIFLSHSSHDSEAAARVRAHLVAEGHQSVFLDFDPAQGIPAGRDWEREIYQQLRACHAVVALCSRSALASKWCFAEVTQAKALGKPLFPVRLDDCEVDPVLRSAQVVDFSEGEQAALDRLSRGLVGAGLDPRSSFSWDPGRPPYPGLLAFQEADAAVYFGRGQEIHEGVARLNHLWHLGGGAGLVVLGPSGTGKSSLLRAGLIPRLRRDPGRWVIVGPFRPGAQPWRAFAMALSDELARHGGDRAWRDIEREIASGGSDALAGLCADLLQAADGQEARVLFAVDQMEEALSKSENGSGFLSGLSEALAGTGSMFVSTLRSDFLAALQSNRGAQDLQYRDLMIQPLSRDRIAQTIEGPAERCGLELESGLTQKMVQDCERGDALPLLAFTLRELFERYGDDGLLTLAEYEALGGLQGAVSRAAEEAYGDAPEGSARSAFLSLVRVDDEGLFVRKTAEWSELPEEAAPLLHRFVEARLLVSDQREGRRFVEVAHEALIRSWRRLRLWVDADREFLLWRKRLAHGLEAWVGASRDPRVLLDGPVLAEASRWIRDRGDDLGDEERAFITASQKRDFLIWKQEFVTRVASWLGAAPDPAPPERRSTWLGVLIGVPFLIAWFLPTLGAGDDTFYGWGAFWLALTHPFDSSYEWYYPIWVTSALSNIGFLLLFASILGWRKIPVRVRFVAALGTALLNAYWASPLFRFGAFTETYTPADLRIGYFVWWACFIALAAALAPAPRSRRGPRGEDTALGSAALVEAGAQMTAYPDDFDEAARQFIEDSRALELRRIRHRRMRLAGAALAAAVLLFPAARIGYTFTRGGVQGIRDRLYRWGEENRRANLLALPGGDTTRAARAFSELVRAYDYPPAALLDSLSVDPTVLIPTLDRIRPEYLERQVFGERLDSLLARVRAIGEDGGLNDSLRTRARGLAERLVTRPGG